MLLITQKVNKKDPVLGFFHDWIIEFAKHASELTVVCLEEGAHDLPQNVRVISLGKEKGYGKVRILWNFLRVLVSKRHDKVFVHMNPEYVVLGGLWWRFRGTRIALWYTHKAVNLKLKIATKLAHTIFSASEESFRYPTTKLRVVGHGILSTVFFPAGVWPSNPHIISVGRISPTKQYEPLIDAMELLVMKGIKIKLSIGGGPISYSDKEYFESLKQRVSQKGLDDYVSFLGPVSYDRVSELYRTGTIFVNLSKTGSLDKAILEAMATGLHVITSNEAMKNLVDSKYSVIAEAGVLARAIEERIHLSRDEEAVRYVREQHSLPKLFKKLDQEFINPPKRICLFGMYNKDYSRNRVITRGFEENGYEVIHCNVDPKKNPSLSKYKKLIDEWKKIRQYDFEKVIVAFPGHSVVPLALFLFPQRKIVFDFFVSLFNSDIEDRQKSSRTSFRACYLWMLDYLSLILSPVILIDTKTHRDFIASKFSIRSSKFRVLPVGSDEAVVYPKKPEVKNEKFIVHFHGTNTPLQGFSVIQKTAKLLEHDERLVFHVYGFSGQNTKNLLFFPRFPYTEMSSILAKADIVLGIFGSTTKAEKVVPNKVFEGLAAQKAVITKETPAIHELFPEEASVVLWTKGNEEDLARNITLLLNDEMLRNRYADNGYEYFKHNLTPKILMSDLLTKLKR